MMKQSFFLLPLLFLSFLVGCNQSDTSNDKEVQSPSLSLSPYLGGKVISTPKKDSTAFSQKITPLNNDEEDIFVLGKSFFEFPWVVAPSSTKARDGLGPLFSANNCITCHMNNSRGFSIDGNLSEGIIPRSLALRLSLNSDVIDETLGFAPEPTYGHQINRNSAFGLPFEATPKVEYSYITDTFSDGESYTLRSPRYYLENLGYGELHADTEFSVHVAAQLVGLGLIEAIKEGDILALSDPEDENSDGISGRQNRVYNRETNSTTGGRFTWKASLPSVRQQVALALLSDIGITSPLYSEDSCGKQQALCIENSRDEIDAPAYVLDSLEYFLKNIAVPKQRNSETPQVQKGFTIFKSLDCIKCHHDNYITGESEVSALSGVEIHPFSDFLIHDMGDGLADERSEFLATGSEWRTPPLWGIGLFKATTGKHHYLHDGRARDIKEAILWHGGEAIGAKKAFIKMPKNDREALLAFLNSL
jgi:CxxC motif-containing protein (DUF1111 family)